MKNNFEVFTDCVYFPLDRPCSYQKNEDMKCGSCPHYKKISQESSTKKILIIKLGAMGDVLRTTFLLNGLKQVYPESHITWIVAKNNAQVLEANSRVDKIVVDDEKTIKFLLENFFDIVINLDLDPNSLALAKLSVKKKLLGYSLDDKRDIICSNEYAIKWLKMSAYDQLKRENDKTYQFFMAKIAELPNDKYEIIVPLLTSSVAKANEFLKGLNLGAYKKIIGLNPGAGKRWPLKKWTTGGYIETAKHFSKLGCIILLLGGAQDEKEVNEILSQNIKNVFSAGINHSVADFFAIINLCDIILCPDTMALHASLGLKKNVAAVFGPTSQAEIEMYGRGTKVFADIDCLCCYRQTCDKKPNCMDLIDPQTIIDAMEKYI
ncbi:MAG: glycosyltransferase family 9 protein [Elusimicrobiota bacterium]|jgi:heptosyltransferase-2|nr:glycosyltransferase family 9 protein [Elusimicrobiota bacterium]